MKIRGQVFNLGTDNGNYSKDDIVRLVLKRMPQTVVEYKDLTFGGDMRDITVSFAKIKNVLGFDTTLDVDDGIREVLFALKSALSKTHDCVIETRSLLCNTRPSGKFRTRVRIRQNRRKLMSSKIFGKTKK